VRLISEAAKTCPVGVLAELQARPAPRPSERLQAAYDSAMRVSVML